MGNSSITVADIREAREFLAKNQLKPMADGTIEIRVPESIVEYAMELVKSTEESDE